MSQQERPLPPSVEVAVVAAAVAAVAMVTAGVSTAVHVVALSFFFFLAALAVVLPSKILCLRQGSVEVRRALVVPMQAIQQHAALCRAVTWQLQHVQSSLATPAKRWKRRFLE